MISFLLLILFSSNAFLISAAGDEYTYKEGTNNGPDKWGTLNPKWEACGNGKLQSPIDLQDKTVQELPQLGKLKIDYKPAPAVLKNRGHDVLIHWNGDAAQLDLNGTYYKLLQCHWHTPSEHTLNGAKFDAELHAVHLSSDRGIAVVGVWYKIGKPDPFLSKLLESIKSIGEKEIDVGVINPRDLKFGTKKYYRYVGSLTTPACSEGVIWTVVKKVKTISEEQIKALKEAVHPGFEVNARPTQVLHGRQAWLYTEKKKEDIKTEM